MRPLTLFDPSLETRNVLALSAASVTDVDCGEDPTPRISLFVGLRQKALHARMINIYVDHTG